MPRTDFDLIPDLDPSPAGVEDPASRGSLPLKLKAKSPVPLHGHALRQASTASPGPVPTGIAANRRHFKFSARPRVYWDMAEVDGVLSTTLAEQLFGEEEEVEVDTLAALCVRGSRQRWSALCPKCLTEAA